jgi:hypothetical protein
LKRDPAGAAHLEHLPLDAGPRCRLAAPPTLAALRRLRRGPSLHAARLDVGSALQAFQPRDLLALPGDHTLELGNLTQQLHDELMQLVPR